MKRALILLIILYVVGAFCCVNAQELVSENIAENSPKDSTDIYQSIYELSRQNSFNKFVYDLIFRKPKTGSDTIPKKSPRKEYDYTHAEGKIIRSITIINRDPFTVDDSDSGFFSQKTVDNIGNFLHVNTQPFIIKNLLLFKEKEVFDSIAVQESERLVRSQRYIDRSAIRGFQVEGTDSVDVYVVVRDKFSISPEGQMSSSRFGLGLKEKNLFGMGHQAHVYYSWNYSGGVHDYQYDYQVPNIMNTFINTGFIYQKSPTDTSEIKRFYVERPFYSSLSQWAGGVNIMQESKIYDVNIPETDDFIRQGFKYNVMDFWGGYAFKMGSRDVIRARTQKLILTGRYYNINYFDSPDVKYDPLNIYSREQLYLVGIGISERTYKKDEYIFRYGFIEDVPVGYANSVIAGFQRKNKQSRLYLGTKWSGGKYTKLGYFSGAFEFGTFFDNLDIEEGVLAAELNYFTPLFKIGGWGIRQFAKAQYMTGINRLKSDRLSLEDYFGISGFNSRSITGTQKFVSSFQTQLFPSWNLWGFKIGPYFVYSLGTLGDHNNGFRKSKVYSMFGLGFIIRNDNLIFNTFEISVSFYPNIPGNGRDIFKFNTYDASDFGMRDFDIKKPEQVLYK